MNVISFLGAALLGMLYKKSLSVDLASLKEGVGSVNNLISVDMKEVQELCCYAQFLWSTLFESAICLALLFLILGDDIPCYYSLKSTYHYTNICDS